MQTIHFISVYRFSDALWAIPETSKIYRQRNSFILVANMHYPQTHIGKSIVCPGKKVLIGDYIVQKIRVSYFVL